MCEWNWSSSSFSVPVRMFTTPPGKSDVTNTSANVMAHRGKCSDAKTTHVFPPAITGRIIETKPIKLFVCGAIIPTTPVGSKVEKLKCELATGFTELNTCVYLSHQPE